MNRLSDVSYEEQHITKFNFFTCIQTLKRIYPNLLQEFDLALKTTTHFAAPFMAAFSFRAFDEVLASVSAQAVEEPLRQSDPPPIQEEVIVPMKTSQGKSQ